MLGGWGEKGRDGWDAGWTHADGGRNAEGEAVPVFAIVAFDPFEEGGLTA